MSPSEWRGPVEWTWTGGGATTFSGATWTIPLDAPRSDLLSRVLRCLRVTDRRESVSVMTVNDDAAYQIYLGNIWPGVPPTEED